MAIHFSFVCDSCGAKGVGVLGMYLYPDPPKGWAWRFGSGLEGPHACSQRCWAAVGRCEDGRLIVSDSHESRADHECRAREQEAQRKARVKGKPEALAWAKKHPGVPMPQPAPVPRREVPWPNAEHIQSVTKANAGRVYFVQRGEDGPIKIGRSRNVVSRLSSLRGSCPDPLRLLGTLDEGSGVEESTIHARFDSARVRRRGEWFKPVPELLSFIVAYATNEDEARE